MDACKVGVLCNTSYKPLPTTPKPNRPMQSLFVDIVSILNYADWDVSCCSLADFNSLVFTKACSRSAIRSSTSSRPTLKRIRLSFTPVALLIPAGILLCVIFAGWLIRLLMPPKLSASKKYFVPVTNAIAAASVSSFKIKETIPPKPLACFLAMWWLWCVVKPG